MQLIACQYDIHWESPQPNFEKIDQMLQQIDIQPGALIGLPEMFSTGYSMNPDRTAEKSPSEAEAFLAETARRYKSALIGGLVYRQADGSAINALAAFNDSGEKLGHYQKNHCFSYAGEDEAYQSGSDIFLFDWNGFTVCPSIRYDLRFPELFRRGVAAGANLFPVLANWPTPRRAHWTTLLQARAIENQAIVMGVNRSGSDPQLQFAGASSIYDCHGKQLAQADKSEGCICAEVTVESVKAWRKTFPALRDMKPSLES